MSPRRHRQRGLSLIEIMIALLLGSLVVVAISQVFLASRQSARTLDALAARQENSRYATYLISRDLRMAGYRGCLRDLGTVRNTLNSPDNFLWRFQRGVEGFRGTGAGWAPALPAVITDAVDDSDVLVVRGILDDGVPIRQSMPQQSADLKVTDALNPPPFANGDIVLISDCGGAAIFQITNYTVANGNIVHNAGQGGGLPVPGNATQDLGRRYPVGAVLYPLATVTYYVAVVDGQRALVRRRGAAAADVIAEGVEALRVQYGEDDDGDFAPEDWRAADAVIDWTRVTAVRLSMLTASPDGAGGLRDERVFTLLGNDYGPYDDRRLRRVVDTTVSLRNRLP